MVKLFDGARLNKGYVLKSFLFALIFWALQFSYQYYSFSPGIFEESLVRSFAFSGATLISAALIIGPLARLSKYNLLAHRRTLGVWGLTFIIMHYVSVMYYYFNFDAALLQAEPTFLIMLLGIISFWIYVPLYLTSTDWAVQKLGFRKWKIIHRLVYIAYILSVVHFTLITRYPDFSYAKALLLALTAAAIALQLLAFTKTITKTKNKKDILIGLLIILFGLAMFYVAFATNMFK